MEVMHHIQCSAQDIGHYVFLPGDPGRVEVIASYLQDAHFVVSNRECTTYTGTLLGVPVSVVSTGIGCPSAAIAMEELTKLGAHTFIRIGTCGCMSPIPTPGDSIIATAAIRRDGTSLQYLPIEFPAVANQQVIQALMLAAREIGIVAHTGIVESKDSYYGQHEPENSPMADELLAKWKMFRQGGAIGSEMESSILFILGGLRRARVGSILHVYRNRIQEDEQGMPMLTAPDTRNTIRTAIRAMELLIAQDQEVRP